MYGEDYCLNVWTALLSTDNFWISFGVSMFQLARLITYIFVFLSRYTRVERKKKGEKVSRVSRSFIENILVIKISSTHPDVRYTH